MREAASRGFFLGSKAPFGYTRIKVSDGVKDRPTLEIDPVAAPIVKEIFESSRRGNGLAEICKELNSRGITNRGQTLAEEHRPLPADQRGIHRHRRLGCQEQGREGGRAGAGGERLARPGVERDLFDAGAAGTPPAGAHGTAARTRLGSQYLLSGLLRCGVCGRSPTPPREPRAASSPTTCCSSLFREGSRSLHRPLPERQQGGGSGHREGHGSGFSPRRPSPSWSPWWRRRSTTLAGEVNGRLTAINGELSDVDTRLENLYQALETQAVAHRGACRPASCP